MSLLVLSEEERAELDDCFDALAGAPNGVIGIKQITKAMEMVLGGPNTSEKAAKAAFETMGPSISGHVDRMAFRAFMLDHWKLPATPAARDSTAGAPPPPAQGFTTSSRRRSTEALDLGALKLSDIVCMYRRQTLAERTLKKAQTLVQRHPDAAQAAAAAVPLSRFRRASMLMLEAVLASEKQVDQSTQEAGGMDSMQPVPVPVLEPESEPQAEPHSPGSSCGDGPMLHQEPADAAAQSAWEQRVLSLCRLNSGYGSRVGDGAEGEVDADSPVFLPVQQLLLQPSSQPVQIPRCPRGPRDPVTGRRDGGSRTSFEVQGSRTSFEAQRIRASFDAQVGVEPTCLMAPHSLLNSCASDFSVATAVPASEEAYSTASDLMLSTGGSNILFNNCNIQPPDVARPLRALGQQSSMGRDSSRTATPSLLGFEGFSTARSDDANIDSSDESDDDSGAEQAGLMRSGSGSTGGMTSWVAKRLTRFVDRDDPAAMDGLAPRSAAGSLLLSTMSRRSSLTMQRCASEHLGTTQPRMEDDGGRQCAMPQPGGASVESLLRRVGTSQRGLLPSLSQGSKSRQGSPAFDSALDSRSGSPAVARARSSVLGVARVDKEIADMQAKLTQQKSRSRDRWNLA